MKRNILSILLACLMIVSLFVLTGCKVDDLAVKVDENATKVENDINDVATKTEADIKAAADKAAANLAAAQAKLEKLIKDGDAADTAAISAAVKDFNAAIAAIDEALTGADGTLKAELSADLEKKIETATGIVQEAASKAIKEATTKLETAIAEGDTATAAQLSEAIAAVSNKFANIDVVVQETAIALDEIVKAELEVAIKELADVLVLKADQLAVDEAIADLADLVADVDGLADIVATLVGDSAAVNVKDYVASQIAAAKDAWNEATELIIDAVLELAEYFRAIDVDFYYDDEYNTITDLYDAYKIRLTRAIDADAVVSVVDDFKADVATVDTKIDVIYAVLTANGETAENVLLNEAWNKAITDAQTMIAAETDAAVIAALADVKALADDMAERYVELGGAELVADALNDRVEALTDAIETEGYTSTNASLYEFVLADIAKWDTTYGEANAFLVDRDAVAALTAALDDAIADYAADAKALTDALAVYNAADYVFVYTADTLKAVNDLYEDLMLWTVDVLNRGFGADGEVEAPVVAAGTAFIDGAYAEAQTLDAANTEANAIEAKVAALKAELVKFSVVKSEYQATLTEIKADVAEWIETYFKDAADDVNYGILDHKAVADVEALYNETVGQIVALADNLKVALEKIKTITIYSGADIEAVKTAYTLFTDRLGDLEYQIEGLEANKITATIVDQTVKFNALVEEVVKAYNALKVLEKADVTLASADDIAALKTWFTTFEVDLTKADSALKADKVVLSDKITIDADDVAAAKAAVAAFDELTAAKKAELDAVKAEIEALVAKTASTALRAELDKAIANYTAWLKGTNAPEGYEDAQYIPVDATVLDTLNDKLVALNKAVIDLEAERDAIIKDIKALVADWTLISDEDLLDKALYYYNLTEDNIEKFTVANNNVKCFDDLADELALALKAIDQATAYFDFMDNYADLQAAIKGLEIEANMINRAAKVIDAAKAAVAAYDEDAIDLANANIQLLITTATEYAKAVAAADGDAAKIAAINVAYELLSANEAMTSADQLADRENMVKETFAAI